MGTIDRPTRGAVYLSGVRVDAKTPDSTLADIRLRHCAFIFQTFNLLPALSALENVELPMVLAGAGTRSSRRRRAIRLLSRVGMGERLHHTPAQLSGGEQQRVTIARALANSPDIILADEPTGDLDGANSQIVLKILTDLNAHEGVTVIMVTHDVGLKAYAHRVVHVLDGKIARVEEVPSFVRDNALDALAEAPAVRAMTALEARRRATAATARASRVLFAASGGGGGGGSRGGGGSCLPWSRGGAGADEEEDEEAGVDGGALSGDEGGLASRAAHPHRAGAHEDDAVFVSDATVAAVDAAAARAAAARSGSGGAAALVTRLWRGALALGHSALGRGGGRAASPPPPGTVQPPPGPLGSPRSAGGDGAPLASASSASAASRSGGAGAGAGAAGASAAWPPSRRGGARRGGSLALADADEEGGRGATASVEDAEMSVDADFSVDATDAEARERAAVRAALPGAAAAEAGSAAPAGAAAPRITVGGAPSAAATAGSFASPGGARFPVSESAAPPAAARRPPPPAPATQASAPVVPSTASGLSGVAAISHAVFLDLAAGGDGSGGGAGSHSAGAAAAGADGAPPPPAMTVRTPDA
jgi:ABC-type lipoprotein export system ATPase subunit